MSKILFVQSRILKFDRFRQKIIRIRWAIFFLGLIGVFLFSKADKGNLLTIIGFILIVLFLVTSILHSRINRTLTQWKEYLNLINLQKNRLNLDWSILPEYRPPGIDESKYDLITATDLHLIGPRSILHLMDSCISDSGQKILLSYLLEQDKIEDIRFRQKKVKELLLLNIFRMKFKLLGRVHSSGILQREEMLQTFNQNIFKKNFLIFFTGLVVLQILNAVLMVGTFIWDIKPYFLLAAPLIYLMYQILKMQSTNAFQLGLTFQLSLERLIPVFKLMEKFPIEEDDALKEEFSSFKEKRPSLVLKKVDTVVALLSFNSNPIIGLILNYFLPWNFGLLIILNSLKSKAYPYLQKWMDSLSRMEALISLADYSETVGGTFPEILNEDSHSFIEAINLNHPLFKNDKRVPNSYLLRINSPISVITGSNMAGKSTFLRTLGLNIHLARAGATVLCDKFNLQNLTVMSLIKAQDFLEKEMSLFYYEVMRLKEILKKGQSSTSEFPFFFLIDEIYRGTNNQERYQGAVAYLRTFSSIPHCAGILTTHDTNIARDIQVSEFFEHYHFQETFDGNTLKYDYKLKRGICETTNALRIMEREGLPT